MTPKEELIEALKQLCKREGGAMAVARSFFGGAASSSDAGGGKAGHIP